MSIDLGECHFHAIYDSDPLLKALLELGEQICDYWNDSEAARAEMMADILSCPPHQREALLAALKGSLSTKAISPLEEGFFHG